MAGMTAAASQQHLASVVALGGGVQKAMMLEGNRAGVRLAVATTFRPMRTAGGFPLIECSKHAQEKATKHHLKSRPKKRNPYDRNRKGPTYYPRVGKPPPIWGLDNGEALTSGDTDGNTVLQV